MHVRTNIRKHTHIHTYIHAYIHMYIPTHTHTHTRMYICTYIIYIFIQESVDIESMIAVALPEVPDAHDEVVSYDKSRGIYYLIQNSQAVKTVCGPQKGYGEKRCEIQGRGQEMAVMVG